MENVDTEKLDTENIGKILMELFEKKPTKDVYEKCLCDLNMEKNKIIQNEENKELLERLEQVIQSIEQYLSIDSI